MKAITHILLPVGMLLLASCSSTVSPAVADKDTATAPSKKIAVIAVPTQQTNTGAETVKGVNKTVNGINRVGSTVRSVQLISGLFR